jgi:putative MATE family efflux protein
MPETEGKDGRFVRMTTAPVLGLVCSLAAPSIVIMLISALYNMADTYFVGALGTSVVAAVGIAFPLMAVIQALGFFFGQGSGNFISRALGARETGRASRMAATGFFSGIIGMTLIAAVCLAFIKPLVKILGATPTIEPYAEEYIFFILLASPWMVAATVLNQQLRFQGSASIAMVGMVSGAVLNIFLDPLFIFVFNMGIRGAAAATMLSQIVSFVVLWAFGCTREGSIRIKLKHFSPSLSIFAEMFRGGVPALLRQGIASLSTVAINHFAGAYGDAAIAAVSIVNRIYMFAGSAMIGFGQGFQPVCGYNYGAKLYNRLKKAFWFCVRLSVAGMALTALVLAFFAPEIIALFRRDDPEVIRIGSAGLRIYCISLPFSAWVIMCNMMTQTIGKALYASLVAISRQGLFLVPCLFVFNRILGLGLPGIQISLPVAEILGFILATPLAAVVLKGMKEPG